MPATITVALDKTSYTPGDAMSATVHYEVPTESRVTARAVVAFLGRTESPPAAEIQVKLLTVGDPGRTWAAASDDGQVAVFRSTAGLTGGTVTARLQVLGQTVTATASYEVQQPQPKVLLGMTAAPSDWQSTVTAFPGLKYTRDFGSPEALSAQNAGKWPLLPSGATMHVSWKGDVELLRAYLDAATKPFYLTWHHEPMSDVTPTVYRSTCARMVQILAAHPKRALCLGHGPVTTRYWLDEGAGNAGDWWYEGATFYGTDCYNGSSTRYRTAAEMFGSAARVARERGVPWLVPEYGIERIGTDTTGKGRAQAMRDHIAWIRQQPDCLAVGWWNRGGNRITGVEPEQTTWRQLLAGGS